MLSRLRRRRWKSGRGSVRRLSGPHPRARWSRGGPRRWRGSRRTPRGGFLGSRWRRGLMLPGVGTGRAGPGGAGPFRPEPVPEEFVAVVHGLLGAQPLYVINSTVLVRRRNRPALVQYLLRCHLSASCKLSPTYCTATATPQVAALSTLVPLLSNAAGREWAAPSKLIWAPGGGTGGIAALGSPRSRNSTSAGVPGPGVCRIYGVASWRLNLTKLACQAGIVISFYDLSRPVPGHRSTLHGHLKQDQLRLGDSPSRRDRRGFRPQLQGVTPSGLLLTAAQTFR